MNPIIWKRSVILKLGLGATLLLLAVYLFLSTGKSGYSLETELFRAEKLIAKQLPWLTEDRLGNFEPRIEDFASDDVLTPPDCLSNVKGLGYGINMTASDLLSMERIIPDTRPNECVHWNYPDHMGLTTSVVIAFHNEGWSAVMRTVHSILKRTPKEMLEEIILVDDASVLENLGEPFDNYIRRFNGKVKVIRNEEREGLIRTRTTGAKAAKGDVIVFLDAHCEVNRNWLPPLLAPIYRDRTVMTVPVIDGIDFQTFKYRSIYSTGALPRGIFEWGMLYKEMDMAAELVAKRKYKSAPYDAPTHAGGLFAIERKYFLELGAYDPGLLIWGAENFELSFKVWQCGGSLKWVPCSRIGHIYRGRPYNVGNMDKKKLKNPNAVNTNYKRVIEVWFDEKYKEFFYTRDPLARYLDPGDISEQLAIKKHFNCKSFAWFMENVAPDLLTNFPELPPNLFWGELRNKGSDYCMDSMQVNPPGKIGLYGCHGAGSNQLFRLNTEGQLGVGERCIDVESDAVKIIVCPMGKVDGPWTYDNETSTLKHRRLEKCVAVHPSNQEFMMRDCEQGLLIWGAENFELSFKVWQCGGSLKWVPCSRIGHIYRGRPYNVGNMDKKKLKNPNAVNTNYKRVIEVWFDEKYKEFFYSRRGLRDCDQANIYHQWIWRQFRH